MSENPYVSSCLFYIFRITTILRFITELDSFKKLPDWAQIEINQQVQQAVVFYLGHYIELIENEDGGIYDHDGNLENFERKGSKMRRLKRH